MKPQIHPYFTYEYHCHIVAWVCCLLAAVLAVTAAAVLSVYVYRAVRRYMANRTLRGCVRNIRRCGSDGTERKEALKCIAMELFRASRNFPGKECPVLPDSSWAEFMEKESHAGEIPCRLLSDVLFMPPEDIREPDTEELGKIRKSAIRMIKEHYV